VRVYCYVSEAGLLSAQIEFSSEQASAACGINKSSHTHTLGRSIGARRDLEDRGVWRKVACNHVARFSNVDTHLASPFQKNAIKFLAAHLIGLRLCDLSDAGEVNVSSALTVVRKETRTPFLRKTCSLDLFSHAQRREGIVRGR
jgi:hypothetical protein